MSASYYLTLFVLKLLGVKKSFSQIPVDYKKLRKEDIKTPPKRLFKKHRTRTFQVIESTVTEINPEINSDYLILYCHGGAFVSGPAQHHWVNIQKIVSQTETTAWMLDYPKAPENTIIEINKNIDTVFSTALKYYDADKIILMGDSVGGNLMMSLTQRLVKNQQQTPTKLILITPVFDASMVNSAIDSIDVKDPMLSKKGVLSAKIMCAGEMSLRNEAISPLYGSFEKFPPTTLLIGGRDIMYPDSKIAIQKMRQQSIELEVIEEMEMMHIWALLPIMQEAKIALNKVINSVNKVIKTKQKK